MGLTYLPASPQLETTMPDSKHSRRKDDHLAEAAKTAMQGHGSNGFDRIQLTHQALPELSLDEIDRWLR